MFRSRAERKVQEAGYDPSRLPPGQYLTEKWPVLHAGDVPSYRPRGLGLPGLRRGRDAAHARLERVRGPPDGVRHAGHPLRHPLEPVRGRVHGRRVVDDPRARDTAGERALRDRPCRGRLHVERPAVLARGTRRAACHARRRRAADAGARLAPAARGPARTSGRAPKWLRAIELRATDAPGFWERYGYHNDADPWKEERHAF